MSSESAKFKFDVILATSAIFGASAAVWGSIVGYWAYNEYVKTNMIALNSRYEEQDGQMNDKIIDLPILAEIYASRPNVLGNELSEAWQIVNRLNGNRNTPAKDDFKGIASFSCDFWKIESTLRTPELTRAYFFAEEHLYLINGTFDNRNVVIASGKTLIDEYDYIVEVGTNPVFLSALFEGARWGYLSDEFSVWARNRLLEDESNLAYLNAIFPELTDEASWKRIYTSKDGNDAC